jgi:hypothetical protein
MQEAVNHLVARAAFARPGDADIRNRMSCAGRVGRIGCFIAWTWRTPPSPVWVSALDEPLMHADASTAPGAGDQADAWCASIGLQMRRPALLYVALTHRSLGAGAHGWCATPVGLRM